MNDENDSWKGLRNMKLIILAGVVLLITGCQTTVNPQHAGDPDYTPDGLVKRPYTWEFKTDGSQKAKDCVLECQKQNTQCRQRAALKFLDSKEPAFGEISSAFGEISIDTSRTEETDQWLKDLDNLQCEKNLIKCVEDICKGKPDKKHYLW